MGFFRRHIDASWIPKGALTEGDVGVKATFHPDGQIHTLKCEVWGVTVGVELSLTPSESSGCARVGLESSSVYRDGAAEQFDAWSDNLKPVPQFYGSWVRRHINDICAIGRSLGEPPPLLQAVWKLEPEALAERLRQATPQELCVEFSGDWNVLAVAAARGDLEVCHRVLEAWVAAGGKLEGDLLKAGIDKALMRDQPAFFEALPRHGYELAMRPPPECAQLLFKAAERSAPRCVGTLLRMGLSPALRIEDGRTPLHIASNVEVARALLDAGAPINDLGFHGITPLLLAMRWQGSHVLAMEKGDLLPDWVSPRGPVIDLLLERGADPDLTENFRGNSVHEAAAAPGPSNLERVLPYSRDLLSKRGCGQTPIETARDWGRKLNEQRLVRELKARGIPIPAELTPVLPPPLPLKGTAKAGPAPQGASVETRSSGGLLGTLRRLFNSGSPR
jgi:hypothetical protein